LHATLSGFRIFFYLNDEFIRISDQTKNFHILFSPIFSPGKKEISQHFSSRLGAVKKIIINIGGKEW
jgi:hypothetical protein